MGGIAAIAQQQGHEVSGCDLAIYPPMSEMLARMGIAVLEGYQTSYIPNDIDIVIVGNAISRGNPILEYILKKNIPYTSGPEWLADTILKQHHVLAVSGTHGKTTTSSILAWILAENGLKPGYLIGGVANNFASTACIGESDYFVIEADEYDSAFFDKRSKFLHYRPHTLIINNLEFDHADIFEDLAAIQKQFAILLRTIPENGRIIRPKVDKAIDEVVDLGCWTPVQYVGMEEGDWQVKAIHDHGRQFLFVYGNKEYSVSWSLYGLHNIYNALAAIAAAHHIGVAIEEAIIALKTFLGVRRRMEVCGVVNHITVYDDFAHHPTSIKKTLDSLRARVGRQRIIAILQFGSNTMRDGFHQEVIIDSLKAADRVVMLQPEGHLWDVQQCVAPLPHVAVCANVDQILEKILSILKPHDHVLIMSNKNFEGIYQRLLNQLKHSMGTGTSSRI